MNIFPTVRFQTFKLFLARLVIPIKLMIDKIIYFMNKFDLFKENVVSNKNETPAIKKRHINVTARITCERLNNITPFIRLTYYFILYI